MSAPSYITGDVPPADDFNHWFVNVNFVRKAASQSIATSTTLANDTHLVLPVDASTTYQLDMMIVYDGPTGGDLKIALIVPAGASTIAAANYLTGAAAGATDTRMDFWNGTSLGVGALGVSNQTALTVTGIIVTSSTSGTAQFQWAQVAASGTTTVYANSTMRLTRLE